MDPNDEADNGLPPERSPGPGPGTGPAGQSLRDGVRVELKERPRKRDVDEQGYSPRRNAMTFCMSSQTIFFSSRFPSLRTR